MHSGEMSNISSTYFHHFDFLFIELEHKRNKRRVPNHLLLYYTPNILSA